MKRLQPAGKLPGAAALRNLFLVFITVTLTAATCRLPPGTPVAFPDDAQVLHGSWEMQFESRTRYYRFQLLAGEKRLLTWSPAGEAELRQGASGQWLARNTEVYRNVFGSHPTPRYDPPTRTFYRSNVGSLGITFRFAALTGEDIPLFSVPHAAGVELLLGHFTDGIAYVVSEQADRLHLAWWGAATGQPLDSREMGPSDLRVLISSNGRTISFIDETSETVTVVNATAPHDQVVLHPGACFQDAVAEVSADGRWYALQDCSDGLILVDLEDPTEQWTVPTAADARAVRFADTGSVLLWLEDDDRLIAYDVTARTAEQLYPPAGATGDLLREQSFALDVDAGLLVVITSAGSLYLEDRTPGGTTSVIPPEEVPPARMELVAELPPDETSSSHYYFSGPLTLPPDLGYPTDLHIEGAVSASGVHEYTPAHLASQMSPPRISIHADITESANADTVVARLIVYGMPGSTVSEYRAQFSGVDPLGDYGVILRPVE